MFLRDRPDGIRVRRIHPLRRMLGFLMYRRHEATVFYEQRFDVTSTLAWLDHARAAGRKVTFFEVFLAACVRTLVEKPAMHRFVSGGVLYQRRRIEVSFVVKKALDETAPMTTVKVRFEPSDTLADVARRVEEQIAVGRGSRSTSSEREMAFFTRLPGFLLRAVVRVARALDAANLMPRFMMDGDPLFASLFVANLGSVGLDAPYHHLYDYGTIPFFGAVGRIHRQPWAMPDGTLESREVVGFKWSFDERIADGYLAARALDRIVELVKDPDALDRPPAVVPDPLA